MLRDRPLDASWQIVLSAALVTGCGGEVTVGPGGTGAASTTSPVPSVSASAPASPASTVSHEAAAACRMGAVTDSNQSFAQQVCFGAACDCTTFTGTAGGPCPGNGVAYECTIGVNGGGASGPGTVIGWHNPGDPHSCACDFSYTYCPARGYTFVTVDTQYRPCE